MATADEYAAWIVKNADKKGTPDFDVVAKAYQDAKSNGNISAAPPAKKTSLGEDIMQGIGNTVAGAVKGASNIGATLLAPYDMAKDALAGKGLSLESNRERRAGVTAGLQSLGAQPDSYLYKGGELASEIAGTAGTGGLAAKAIQGGAKIVSPLASSIASGGFNLGANVGKNAVVNGATRLAGGAITGGLSAGIVNPEDAGKGAVLGAAIPVVAKAAGAAGSAIGNKVSPEVKALYDKAQTLGIDVPADRLINSRPVNALASSLNYVPLSGRAATEDKMASQVQKAVSKTFGQNTDNITQALRNASSDLGNKFENVLSNNTVKVDNQFLTELASHEQTALDELSPEGANIIKKQINNILDKGASGDIDGQAAYNIKKTLDRISNRNSNEAFYARDLKNSLMGALNRSLPSEEAQAFAKVRQQYGNMLAIENLAQNGAEGGISIARLANMKNINNQDLQDIADISAQFVKAREGAHGAAQRVTLGALGGAAAGASGQLPLAAAGMMVGRLTNKALNSNALKNSLINGPRTTEQINALAANPLLRSLGTSAISTNP